MKKGTPITNINVNVIALAVLVGVMVIFLAALGISSTGAPTPIAAGQAYPICIPDSCNDTDGGIYSYAQGIVRGVEDDRRFRFTDSCLVNNTVKEYFCDFDETNSPYPDSREMRCLYMCENGVCIPFCGNGVCEPGETVHNCPIDCPGHLECIFDSYCGIVQGSGSNECYPEGVTCTANITHLACVDDTCRTVNGSGGDECWPGGSACANQTTHLECIDDWCTAVNGSGSDECWPEGSYCGGNQSLPDLIVSSIDFYAVDNQSNQSNTTVTISATIENIGDATAGSSYTRFSVYPYQGGGGDQSIYTLPIEPDGMRIVNAVYYLESGTYNATVIADIYDAVTESIEVNNDMSRIFSIGR